MTATETRSATGNALKAGPGPHVARRKPVKNWKTIEAICDRCDGAFVTVKRGGFVPSLCAGCKNRDDTGLRWCIGCKTDRPIADFYQMDRPGANRMRCRPCYVRKASDRYAEHSARIREYKVARGCADCGYNAHPAALDFDHLPGVEKKYNVGRMASVNWETVLTEIAKCEVVCANCHRIRTVTRNAEARQ